MSEVLAHPWMTGPKASYEQIVDEFKERKALIDQDAAEKREQKRDERRAAKQRIDDVAHRGGVAGEEGEKFIPYSVEDLQGLEVQDFDTYV